MLVSLISMASASGLSDFGKALLKKDAYYLPDGDLGKLGKALLKDDAYYLPEVVFYSFKPNHKETKLLTQKVKDELIAESAMVIH